MFTEIRIGYIKQKEICTILPRGVYINKHGIIIVKPFDENLRPLDEKQLYLIFYHNGDMETGIMLGGVKIESC